MLGILLIVKKLALVKVFSTSIVELRNQMVSLISFVESSSEYMLLALNSEMLFIVFKRFSWHKRIWNQKLNVYVKLITATFSLSTF